ncbi:DUF4365 domain-containing protein [Halococcus sp. PRR34]|uniref:DUF4365 domain-containing protein n=1 Tax=Halococcus sp. PRR34 TaxID=3020830 RepID=UPI0023624D24|nr:DUF4365 domain-containing protein [Halococcus sp. PRR34]
MGKRKDRKHELERYSRGRLQMTLSRWVVNSLDEDYAFDFEVRPTEGFETDSRDKHGNKVLPSPFYVQLKSSEKFNDQESVWHDLDTDFLIEDCLQASIPVVLVICDRDWEELYWCVLQSYCWDVLDEERNEWREQSEVRVRIERKPLSDSIKLSELRSALQEAEHRLSTRHYVASARRGTLHHPAKMDVASSTQVREYKREVVEDALDIASAGRIERALSKLMEVYQMAEEDEQTLEAVRYLLELRVVDGPGSALTKISLANVGLRLADQFEREGLLDEFETHADDAIEYLDETFIGAQYRGPRGLPIRILGLGPMGSVEIGMIAHVQHGFELTDLNAQTIAEGDQYERIESGKSNDPVSEACAEREHDFGIKELRDTPAAAICSACGLSHVVIEEWLSHDVPHVCDGCGEIAYEVEIQVNDSRTRERLLCTGCT